MLPSAVPYCSDIRTIGRIDFSLLSSDEVRRSAVVVVSSSRLVQPVHVGTSVGGTNQVATTGLTGTLYDPRFGTIERLSRCATCGLNETECPGHRGVIQLDEPIFYPPTIANNEVLKVLRTLCFVCRDTLIDLDWVKLHALDQHHGLKRWSMLSVMLKEDPIRCRKCQTPQLDFRIEEYRVFAYAQDKRFRVTVPRKARAKPGQASVSLSSPLMDVVHETTSFKQEVSARQVLEMMGVLDISVDMDTRRAEAWQQLTGSPESPLHMVMTAVGVLELRNRPYIIMNSGLSHDDITFKYSEIVKTNEKIRKALGKAPVSRKGPGTPTPSEPSTPTGDSSSHETRDLLRDLTAHLFGHVRTLYHNKNRQSKNPHTQTPTKDFQKRLDTKAGRIRGNLSGKRVNFSTRAPISPDASLDADVVRMSPLKAKVLTFPMHVTSANMARADALMRAGKVNAVIRKNTQPITEINRRNPLPLRPKWFDVQALRRARFTKVLSAQFELQEGDIVHTRSGPRVLATQADVDTHQLEPNDRVVRDKQVVYPLELTPPRDEVQLWTRASPGATFQSKILRCMVRREPTREFPLKVGDIIERQYETGMSVYFNRQPTLHIGSMLERKLVIDDSDPWLTMRFNLSGTDSFNADMDGDEMTMWCPTCLTASDTRILTDQGFLFLDEIEARLSRGDTVLYACYEKTHVPSATTTTEDLLKGQLIYRTGKLVYPAPPTELVVFNSSPSEARRWSESGGPYGVDEKDFNDTRRSRHVSLRVTPLHKMYVQLGIKQLGQACSEVSVFGKTIKAPPEKVSAYDLLSRCDCPADMSCDHRARTVRMLSCADQGRQPSAEERARVRTQVQDRLQLTDAQWPHFLELFGFWLGDGSMNYSNHSVSIGQVKATDVVYIDAALAAVGLLLDPNEHQLCRSVSSSPRHEMEPVVITTWNVIDNRWFEFFDKEFGRKFPKSSYYQPNPTALEQTVQQINNEEPHTFECECECLEAARPRTALNTLRSQLGLRASRICAAGEPTSAQRELNDLAGITATRGRPYRGLVVWWLRNEVNNQWGRECQCGQRVWTTTKVGVNVRMLRHAEVCDHPVPAGDAPKPALDPVHTDWNFQPGQTLTRSVRWFPPWVMLGLTPEQSRLIVNGLWRADGGWSGQHKWIATSGVVFRDQLLQLLMHCGYSAFAALDCKTGTIRGFHNRDTKDQRIYTLTEIDALSEADRTQYSPITTTADAWRVSWTDTTTNNGKQTCWPVMLRQESITTEPYVPERDGRIWCVTVDHPDHLIVAQRAHRHNGVVTKQSRPIIVGQSLASVAELVCCAGTEAVVKTSEDGRLLQVLKQDALTGGYLLTHGHVHGKPLSRADFFQCCMLVPNWSLDWIELRLVAYCREVLQLNLRSEFGSGLSALPDQAFTGHSLLSLLFPISFSFDNPAIKLSIKRGLIHTAVFNKQVLSEHRGSMLHLYESLYGARPVIEWISAYQILVVSRLRLFGFSIGMKDTELVGAEVQSVIESNKRTSWVDAREAWLANDRMSEVRISAALNNIKALGERVTTEFLESKRSLSAGSSNGIITGIASGAKGSFANVASMTVMVGQQNVEGRRIPFSFNGELGERTLPSYLGEQMYRDRVMDDDKIFDTVLESRGRITSPYRQGLTPQEYFFAAQAGREGMIDTAIKSVSGDTRLFIVQPGGKVVYTEIGRWVDQLMTEHLTRVQKRSEHANMEYLELNEPWYIQTMDDLGRMSWGTITAATRHDPGALMYHIRTKAGRTVKVVESESLLVWDDGLQRFVPRLTSRVVVGDLVPVARQTPAVPSDLQVDTFSVAQWFPKNKYIHGTDWHAAKECVSGREWDEASKCGLFTLPYANRKQHQLAMYKLTDKGKEEPRVGRIYTYRAGPVDAQIPDTVPLTRLWGTMVGIYLADGLLDKSTITIDNACEQILASARTFFDSLGVDHATTAAQGAVSPVPVSRVDGQSVVLAKLFERWCGKGSWAKHVPDVALIGPLDFALGILCGYWSCDSVIQGGAVATLFSSARSVQLNHGMLTLANRFGIFGRVSAQLEPPANNVCERPRSTYTTVISGESFARLARTVVLLDPEKQAALVGATPPNSTYKPQNDVMFDRVESIVPLDRAAFPKVYDLTVPGTFNFGLANGLQVRDTGRSGLVSNNGSLERN